MDWEKILTSWGPLAGIAWLLWKVHREVLVKQMPREFKLMRRLLSDQEEEAEMRHVQQLETHRLLAAAISKLERSMRIMFRRVKRNRLAAHKRKKTPAK
jgi:hypothetical protein